MRVDGQLVFNGTVQMLNAALAGFGLAYVPEELAQPHLAKDVSSGCSTIGARRFRDTTFIIRAGVTRRPRSPCWSMRCATGVSAARLAVYNQIQPSGFHAP